jgi:glycerate-2-kinase
MNATDLVGYLASAAVLLTFCMRDIVALRATAIASNLAFIGYATLADVRPVLLLHAVLLPINVCRLLEASRGRRVRARSTSAGRGNPCLRH